MFFNALPIFAFLRPSDVFAGHGTGQASVNLAAQRARLQALLHQRLKVRCVGFKCCRATLAREGPQNRLNAKCQATSLVKHQDFVPDKASQIPPQDLLFGQQQYAHGLPDF